MREITTEEVKVGEHIIIDGEEYVAEEAVGKTCDLCALHKFHHCILIPCDCDNVIFKKANEVKKEPQYRPYKDTEEMIADYKERFNVEVPSYSKPSIWVNNGRISSSITDITPEKVVAYGYEYDMKDLFRIYTYLDGSPCGKVEE